MSTEKRTMGMPEVEFEGPMGMFWSMEEVPFEALTKAIAEITQELSQRGYIDEIILAAVRTHSQSLKEKP